MLEYNPALDGLRAMAVIAVMLFHAKVPGVLGGFLGVDVFFVLSGYLITRIIHEKRRLHAFSFTDFYRKRAVRILPPLFVAACFTALLALAVGESVSETRIVSALLFYTNIDLAMNYSRALFAHSWSLSLEEQFYLVWPITLMVILRFAKTPSTWVFILYVGAVLWRGYLVVAGLEWIDIYYRPDTRLSGLLLGSALGLGLYRANVTPKLAFAALLVLLFCFHQAEWREMSVFYTSLPAVEISTALIIISLCSSRGAIYRLLSKRVLV